MVPTIDRKQPPLRRVLFLCELNYHEGRFCEEFFNSYARTEGANWLASSRALVPAPAAVTEAPISVPALQLLRALGVAPVNHLRLPLQATDLDVRMSHLIVALNPGIVPKVEELWPHAVRRLQCWSGPAGARHTLNGLARDVQCFLDALTGGAAPAGADNPSALWQRRRTARHGARRRGAGIRGRSTPAPV